MRERDLNVGGDYSIIIYVIVEWYFRVQFDGLCFKDSGFYGRREEKEIFQKQ